MKIIVKFIIQSAVLISILLWFVSYLTQKFGMNRVNAFLLIIFIAIIVAGNIAYWAWFNKYFSL